VYHSLIQLLAAAKLIAREQGATMAELEEKLGLSRRSIFRALEAMDELGYPYWNDREHGNRYRLVGGGYKPSWWVPLPSVQFSLEDRVVLDYLFESASRAPGLSQELKELRKKLSLCGAAAGSALEPKDGGAGPKSQQTPRLLDLRMPPKAMPEDARILIATILDAIHDSIACQVSYESRESGSVKTYRIHPLALFEADGGLYCFVEVARYGSIRMLALERIKELTKLDEHFTPPADFDAQRLLDDPFGIVQGESFPVRLHFDAEQSPYIKERTWPADYVLEPLIDGSLTMSFTTGGLFALKRWIQSWGSSVRVEEPDWLALQIVDDTKKVLGLYSKDAGQ